MPLEDLLVTQRLSREIAQYKDPSPAARAAAQLEAIGQHVRPGQKVRFLLLRGERAVHAWNLPASPEPQQLDFARYRELTIRAASNIFAPLGISEGLLNSLVGGEGVAMELEGMAGRAARRKALAGSGWRCRRGRVRRRGLRQRRARPWRRGWGFRNKKKSATKKRWADPGQGFTFLLAQISQVLFHRLDFQFQVHEVAFQVGDLFRLGLVAPLKVPAVTAAITDRRRNGNRNRMSRLFGNYILHTFWISFIFGILYCNPVDNFPIGDVSNIVDL